MKQFHPVVYFLGILLVGMAIGGLTVHALVKPTAPATPSEVNLPPVQWEATLYLPLQDNQGQPFPKEVRDRALDILIRKFGGATLGPERQGCWLDPKNQIQREPIQLVTISFPEAQLEEFRAAVKEMGQVLRQQEVYIRFEKPRIESIVIPPKKDG